ncbi:MAG: SRPBCC family protein [Acidimicrobiales bacterium]
MTDIDDLIATVARSVDDRQVEGRPAKSVVLSRTYPTTIDDLWVAVTTPDRLARWMGPVSGDLELGGRYRIEGNASGTITACDPPHSFDATWEYAGVVSWIEVQLVAVDSSHTRLQLAHLAHPDEHWDQFGPGAAGVGWDLALMGLHLSGETDAPAETAEEWMASPDGVRFTVGSAHAWGAADVASGTDADAARAAVDRTVAAYTEVPPED